MSNHLSIFTYSSISEKSSFNIHLLINIRTTAHHDMVLKSSMAYALKTACCVDAILEIQPPISLILLSGCVTVHHNVKSWCWIKQYRMLPTGIRLVEALSGVHALVNVRAIRQIGWDDALESCRNMISLLEIMLTNAMAMTEFEKPEHLEGNPDRRHNLERPPHTPPRAHTAGGSRRNSQTNPDYFEIVKFWNL